MMHIVDFLWAGTENFQRQVENEVKSALKIGNEAEWVFRYIRLEIYHYEDGIMVTKSHTWIP